MKKSPARRRYRHNWEKAIRALERAARGPDTGPALLDAARARYALYRFSAVESDREAALRLAARASKAGAPQAASLAAAIRREAGDEPAPVAKADPQGGRARRTSARRPRPRADPPPRSPPPAGRPRRRSRSTRSSRRPWPTAEPVPSPEPGARRHRRGPRPTSTEVHSWTSPDYTRVAVYLSQPVAFEKQELPAGGDQPRRLALDLAPARCSTDPGGNGPWPTRCCTASAPPSTARTRSGWSST